MIIHNGCYLFLMEMLVDFVVVALVMLLVCCCCVVVDAKQ